MIKKITAVLAIGAVGMLFLPETVTSGMIYGRAGSIDYAPQVRIISPDDKTVDLTGQECLVLHWSWIEGDRMERQYYDVRIYRGYDMLESTLIFKIQTAPDADRICVRSDLFANGGIYTWSIRQRYIGLAKSRRSYASFGVIKR
jgi:hypothetical protein